LLRVKAGEQRGARGTAPRGVVKLREAQAIGRECIEARRGDFTAIASDVRKAHVVGENDDDVWSFGSKGRCGHEERGEDKDENALAIHGEQFAMQYCSRPKVKGASAKSGVFDSFV